jgi:hypothetical protein
VANTGAISGATTATLTFTGATIADTAGNYNVVITRTLNATTTTTTSSNAALRVNAAPVIGTGPANTTVVSGTNATFTVAATVVGGGTLSYQWRKGTTNLTNTGNVSGTTTTTLTLTGTALADTGLYNVIVTSTLNAVTTSTTSGNASLFVNTAPTITTQPAASTPIVTGTSITLTVVAGATVQGTSSGTITYQWRKNGTNLTNTGNISGATTASLLITNPASPADTGHYSVVITRTLNATTTTVTSNVNNGVVLPPVSIMPGSFVFRVTGAERPYTFRLPAGASETEQVTMSISDIWGRTIWTKSIYPSRDAKAREVVWNGRTATGRQASAGMYVVRVAVKNNGETTNYVRKAVTLKP